MADDSYRLMDTDIDILKSLSVNSYRFSISWSRILPTGYGDINYPGISHYSNLIDKLLEAGIEPLVTLYHWDLPQGLEDQGGLLNPKLEEFFEYYADVCFRYFGNRVKKWITFNEPWTVAFMGYGLGVFAPGRCSDRTRCPEGDSTIESYIAAHNMLNAHSAAVALYRRKYQGNQKGVIGITLNQDWAEPLTDSAEDIAAAERRIEFQLGWFADPILFGDYPLSMKRLVGLRLPPFTEAQKLRLKGSLDFLGLNHYSTKYYFERNPSSIVNGVIHSINITTVEEGMKIGGWAADQMNYETKFNLNGTLVGEQAASSWLNMVPWGFYKTVMWVHHRYSSLYPGSAKKQAGIPIIITENGCDAPGESEKPLLEALNDTYRASYLQQYIDELHHAITDGANIQGYFAWSMLDNFE